MSTVLTDNDAVLVAVLLHEIDGAVIGADETIAIATRGEATDGAAIVAAVRERYPTAVSSSETSGGGPRGPVTLRATGGKAVRFDAGPVQWDSKQAARVLGCGGHRGGHAREIEYSLERADTGWTVTTEKLLRLT